jgi:hypothetical protein
MKKYSWLSMNNIELEEKFLDLHTKIVKELGLEGILKIDTKEDLYKVVNSYKKHPEYYSKDSFFISERHKLVFLLTKHKKGIFDEELGIKKKHYIDNSVAKEWKNKYIKMFHPDKNIDDKMFNYGEVTQCINKIYNRMVGNV